MENCARLMLALVSGALLLVLAVQLWLVVRVEQLRRARLADHTSLAEKIDAIARGCRGEAPCTRLHAADLPKDFFRPHVPPVRRFPVDEDEVNPTFPVRPRK